MAYGKVPRAIIINMTNILGHVYVSAGTNNKFRINYKFVNGRHETHNLI